MRITRSRSDLVNWSTSSWFIASKACLRFWASRMTKSLQRSKWRSVATRSTASQSVQSTGVWHTITARASFSTWSDNWLGHSAFYTKPTWFTATLNLTTFASEDDQIRLSLQCLYQVRNTSPSSSSLWLTSESCQNSRSRKALRLTAATSATSCLALCAA